MDPRSADAGLDRSNVAKPSQAVAVNAPGNREVQRVVAMLPNGRGGLYRGRISVEDRSITGISPMSASSQSSDQDLDVTPHIALPGFVDVQLNGAFGHDITTDPSSMWIIGERLLSHGVTAFLPTVITSPPKQRHAAYEAIRNQPDGYIGAAPLGLHIEGPELAPEYAGTHPREDLADGAGGLADELLRQVDAVSLVTVAPEIDSAMGAIPQLVQAGIRVSLGHTAATAKQTLAALDAGASALTHLFNGMGPLHHREVGAAGKGLLDPRAFVSLIADEHHLSAEAIQIAWQMGGPGRICLVTDAMAGMGAPPGTYRIGSEVVYCDETARNEKGSLAGSLLTMPDALRRVRRLAGATWDDISAIASENQANLLGDGDRGRLAAGRRADIAIVDAALRPVATVLEGKLAFHRDWRPDESPSAAPRSGTGRTRAGTGSPAHFSSSGDVLPAAIGVDVGGTTFKAAVYSGGRLRHMRRGDIGRGRPPTEVLAEIRTAIEDLARLDANADICGVGVGVPGVVNAATGVAVNAVNLDWRDVEVVKELGRGLGLPVRLEHDVYLAASAEWETGSGVGADSMLYVSVGTGVAARLFTEGGTERGSAHMAGEMGFIPVRRHERPLESVASAAAMQVRYQNHTGRSKAAAEIISDAPHDPAAAQVWSDALDALAHGLSAAVCLHDPGIVVIGGGLSNAGGELLTALESRLASLLDLLRAPPRLMLASHGDQSGVIGAALHGGANGTLRAERSGSR